MAEKIACQKCGVTLAADAPPGYCLDCRMQAGPDDESDAEGSGGNEPTRLVSGFVPPEPGELAVHFPQLDILEILGKGGMGAVYKARQKSLDRLVALKILPPEVGHDPAFAERFAREARALARLSHQNIVAIYDFGQVDKLFYFIMELVDGVNLRQALRTRNFQPAQALAIVPQICAALQFAHDEAIVHRDIKPENILLDQRGRVKIADFGLAKLLGTESPEHMLTGTHQIMGTLNYMAPEQMQGSRTVDHRADIYSLGVVFYEMLTGQLPLGRFEPPSKSAPIDARLDDVVLRSLEAEPNRRYQQASDLKSEVEAITGAARTAILPQTPEHPPSVVPINNPTRKRWLVPAIFGGLLALWGILILSGVTFWMHPGPVRAITILLGPLLALSLAFPLVMRIRPGLARVLTVCVLTLSIVGVVGVSYWCLRDSWEFDTRIESARRISASASRDETFAKIALDAAAAGKPESVEKAIRWIMAVDKKDVAASEAAVKLAEIGQRSAANEVISLISGVTIRDNSLRRIAELP